MNRASSRKDLRSERINNSPYRRSGSRSERPPVAKQSSWLSSLATSITSSLSSRFRQRDGSVSGSDDEWGGDAPSTMVGQDVFSLAEAAGRGGDEFEARAESWRASKSLLSSKRLSPSKSAWSLLDLEPKRVRPSPSMPSLQPLPAAPRTGALFRTPTTQVGRSNGIPNSASAAALQAFVSSKADGQYSAQDIESMETLLRSVKADAMASQPTGGWSGALTTVRTPAPSSPGSAFSIGSTPPAARVTAHHRVKYLGPGMSPRRFRASTSMRSMSSLFEDDTPGKKRKTLPDVEVEVLDDEHSKPTQNIAAASKAAEFNQRARDVSRTHRPSPLAQSVAVSPDRPPTPRDIGRKRVNDIIQDVLDNEITPHEETPKQVFNPYEASALPAGKHYTPYASLRKSSSSNGSMRRSLGASRGAAARLDSERMKASTSGRPLSTLDLINSGRPSAAKKQKADEPAPAPKKQRKPSDEPIVIDDDDEPAPPKAPKPPSSAFTFSSTPSRKTRAAVTIDEPEPVSAFPAPSLSQSTRGSPAPAPKSAAPAPVPSTSDSIIAASKPAPAPLFSTQPLDLGPAPPASVATPSKPRAPSRPSEKGNLYMSAKDTALNVDKNTLPFFTFTLPPGSNLPQPSEAVKATVSAGPPKTDGFTFEIPNAAQPTSYYSPPSASAPTIPSASFSIPKQAAPAGNWTCDLCMLQNTAADTEKCKVCEAPKPGAKPKAAAPAPSAPPAAPSGGFNFAGAGFKPPAKAEGEWNCDVCTLKNPPTATEKCTICEAPKPGGKPAPAADWTCDLCMLKNPATATDKCTVCEAPRPGAAPKAAAMPAAPPAAPAGGFSFGGKSLSTTPASTPPAPPSGGFSFGGKPVSSSSAAAPTLGGFKAPTTGGFSFGGKTVGGDAAPAAPSFGGFGGFGAPPAGGFSFGQKKEDKPAMLSKPTGAAGEWTCTLCGLLNPASATDKCTICEAPK